MKKRLSAALTAVMTAAPLLCCPVPAAQADNPMVQTTFTTDPAPMVYGDTLYVYTGRDKDNSSFYYMPDWHCYSTKDMQNWTDHGTILSWSDFSWGKEDSAWASQCIERNGKFYYYVTLENKSGGGRAIGVAVADSPEGPFKDALGKPLCGPNWDYIDPTVFIDDDGQAWLMFGNPTCYYVKLNEDMISYSGSIGKMDMTTSAFGTTTREKAPTSYGEGPWFYKRGNLYYLVYASFTGSDNSESLSYSTATSPTGPWTYRGQIMKPHNCFTNHPGVIDFKGKSYLFYHDASLKNGGTFNRSVCVDEFSYGSDGSIPLITPSKTGPEQIASLDPFSRVEGETMCWSSGVATEKCSEGGLDLANIENGDYIKLSGVDFGDGADEFTASVASNTDGGKIELHIDDVKGPVIGVCNVGNTGGWQKWEEASCDVTVDGKHDLYLVFSGGSGYLLNVDWWKFTGPQSSVTDPDPEGYIIHNTFENGTNNWSGRGNAEVAVSTSEKYDGRKALLTSGRTASWNGAILELGSDFKAGSTYSFSTNVMYPSGGDYDKFYLTLQYNDENDDPHYDKIASASPLKGEWAQLANPNFTIPANAKDICIYVETEKSKVDFYVDEFVAAEAGITVDGAKGRQFNPGDINGDGHIDVFDLILAKQSIVTSLSNEDAMNPADADKSGVFEVNDVILLNQYVLGKIKEFPDNSPEPPAPVSNFNYDPAVSYHEPPNTDENYLEPCSQAGKITKETYTGIRGTKSLNVYTPYNYDPSKKYNVFYLMHGGGENENTIFSNDVKLQHVLDHMIKNGELEPLIVVTPTFNGSGSEAGNFWDEFRQNVVPFVEGKYSTYAESTSLADLQKSRMHRAYGGFSMGGLSTWCVADHDMDIVGYFMPLSGNNWEGMNSLTKEIDSLGFSQRDYFIFAATGDQDIAYGNMKPEMEDLKTRTKYFTYTSDFSKGNLYWLVAPSTQYSKKTHWWGFVRWYIYDGLPYFFHEGQ